MEWNLASPPMRLNQAPTAERIRSRLQRLNIALKQAKSLERQASLQAEVDRLARLSPAV